VVLAQGKQVVLIAPTTVLAEQHYTVFSQRLAELPIRCAHLSRVNKGGEKMVIDGLSSGEVDVVVGTHRLLGKDVTLKDLGLLIIDEEQKFGVSQKEKLKKLRPTVDVLSLSATPIPRTLYLALSGLRGLSVLNRAPRGRLPIITQVMPYTDETLGSVLVAELERGGQVYLVHNRVRSLRLVEERVHSLLAQRGKTVGEGVTVAVAHGQMDETRLAETMSHFLAGQVDILIASAIVENGLDSPRANTLAVLHSERFGLSDLYQLRGRVGRRTTQAHAYFFTGGIEYGEGVEGGEELIGKKARQRLAVLQDSTELGSGWSVALRDLEIRGGGNVLGHEQHGSMEAVGLILYSQLLQEEIGRQARKLGISLFQKIDVDNTLLPGD
jgi:transcription-repair coupling factor (superfamily II helicase)